MYGRININTHTIQYKENIIATFLLCAELLFIVCIRKDRKLEYSTNTHVEI